jgi:hypothetical protein
MEFPAAFLQVPASLLLPGIPPSWLDCWRGPHPPSPLTPIAAARINNRRRELTPALLHMTAQARR